MKNNKNKHSNKEFNSLEKNKQKVKTMVKDEYYLIVGRYDLEKWLAELKQKRKGKPYATLKLSISKVKRHKGQLRINKVII